MTPVRSILVVALVFAAVLAACDLAGPPGPPASATTAGGGGGSVQSGLGAVEAIRERVPLFDGLGVRIQDFEGQASFFTVDQVEGGWRVVFETGWGDCQAGCIDRHRWTWDVAPGGELTFLGEDGSPLAPDVLAALQASAEGRTGVAGRVAGGPSCPVEQPGDPACAPRVVAGAVLTVRGGDGSEVARVTTDGSGLFRIALPPGDYTLEAAPVEGFMSAPGPQPFTVTGGAETWLDVPYDTGIR
jgi:hypothetical protein